METIIGIKGGGRGMDKLGGGGDRKEDGNWGINGLIVNEG